MLFILNVQSEKDIDNAHTYNVGIERFALSFYFCILGMLDCYPFGILIACS